MFDFPDDRGRELTADFARGLTLDPAGSFFMRLVLYSVFDGWCKGKSLTGGTTAILVRPRLL